MPRGLVSVYGSERRLLSHPNSATSQTFLRFAFEGVAYQYTSNPAYGSSSAHEWHLHINCVEMMAVCLALKTFLPALKGHHVLDRSDKTTVVAYINHQGSLRSRPLHRMTRRLLLWARRELLSLRAVHVPGRLNQGADMLSRDNVAPGKWRLHPQTVQIIWSDFSKAEVDLFASEDNYWQLAQRPSVCLPSDRPATPGYQVSQGNEVLSPPRGPSLEEPRMVPGDDAAAICGETFSHKCRARFGIPRQNCGAFMPGHSMGV